MPIDNTIALQVAQPDAMGSLNSMLSMQQNQLNLQKSRETFQSDVDRNKAESQKAVGTVQPTIDLATAQAKSAQEQSEQQHLTTMRDQLMNGSQQLAGMRGTGATGKQVKDQLVDTLTNSNAHQDAINMALQNAPSDEEKDPKIIDGFIAHTLIKSSGIINQIDKMYPNPVLVNNGQTQTPVAAGNQELTGVVPGTPQGTPITNQAPPTTQIFNPKTNANELLGNSDGTGKQTSPALGQVDTVNIPIRPVSNDWETTQQAGSKAAQNIGILQNIKQYAPGAVTGVGQDRRALTTKLLGLVGIHPDQEEATNTDLLAKNSAMLALAGGDTNLAKTLAEVANPNVHMTKDAILHAADQVISQQQLNLAKQDYFSSRVANPMQYQMDLAKWNNLADARVLQYPEMSKSDKQAMSDAMSKSQRLKFKAGLKFFQKEGYIQ